MFNEQRQSVRKVLKVKAMLAMDQGTPSAVRTVDVSPSGVSVNAPGPVPVGATGQVSFDLYYDGKNSTINARVKATHCIYSNGEFKVGFQFTNLELSGISALAKYMR